MVNSKRFESAVRTAWPGPLRTKHAHAISKDVSGHGKRCVRTGEERAHGLHLLGTEPSGHGRELVTAPVSLAKGVVRRVSGFGMSTLCVLLRCIRLETIITHLRNTLARVSKGGL